MPATLKPTRKPAREGAQRAGFLFPKVFRGPAVEARREDDSSAESKFRLSGSDLKLDDGARPAYATRPSLARRCPLILDDVAEI